MGHGMGQTVFPLIREFISELLAHKTQEKVLKSYDFRTFYGCGGRTRTYDLRVMSGDIPNLFNLKIRVYLQIS